MSSPPTALWTARAELFCRISRERGRGERKTTHARQRGRERKTTHARQRGRERKTTHARERGGGGREGETTHARQRGREGETTHGTVALHMRPHVIATENIQGHTPTEISPLS